MKKLESICHWTRPVVIAALVSSWLLLGVSDALAQAKKPNILVIFGDDIGVANAARIPTGWSATARRTSIGLPGKE